MSTSWTREEEVYFVTNVFDLNINTVSRILHIHPILLKLRFRGNTILHRSIQMNNVDVFNLCLSILPTKYLEEKTTNIYQYTPLHLAVLYNRPFMIQSLIEKGVDVNLQDYKGNSALHYAVQNLMVECTALLYDKTDTTLTDKIGNDVIFSLLSTLSAENYSKNNFYSILDMLFMVYDKDTTNTEGRSYLYYPVIYGYENLVKYLISKNVDVYMSDANDKTVIDYAYETQNIRIASILEHAGENS